WRVRNCGAAEIVHRGVLGEALVVVAALRSPFARRPRSAPPSTFAAINGKCSSSHLPIFAKMPGAGSLPLNRFDLTCGLYGLADAFGPGAHASPEATNQEAKPQV